jgi:hypothetical protein
MVDRSVLYTIELFTLGVKTLIHTDVISGWLSTSNTRRYQ